MCEVIVEPRCIVSIAMLGGQMKISGNLFINLGELFSGDFRKW